MSEDWETRVRELEGKGLTRSDAQAVVDAEDALKQVDLIPALEASIALIERHEAKNAQKTLFDTQPEEQPSKTAKRL